MRGGRRQHRRPAAASLCSSLPAIHCAFVSGSKIFTFPPPNLSLPGPRAAAPLCSPLPAIPYAFVSGSKIFTFPPPDLSFSAASLCSPLPAIPCAFVPGSKIFTFPPPDLSLPSARWRRLWLAGSFGGARKSKKRCKEGLIGHPCITFSILFLSKKECPQCGGVFRPPTRTPGFHSCGVLAASRCRSSGPSGIRSGPG